MTATCITISVGAGSGDPHYTTFDNKRYTFAAVGEYTAFGVNDTQGNAIFYMQVRLGTRGWPASTTVAIAFGVPGVYAYQVSNYYSSRSPKCEL